MRRLGRPLLVLLVLLHAWSATTEVSAQGAGALSDPAGGDRPAPPPPRERPAPPPERPAPTTPPAEAAPPAPAAEDLPDELADTSPGTTGEAPPPPTPPRSGMRLLVVDAATFGIDPVVGEVASARMRQVGHEMGYDVVSREDTVTVARRVRMPYPPAPADLWRVSWAAEAQRGAFARIWAHAGRYVVELTVASLDGSGPFHARGTAGADDLREVVDGLFRSALPPPSRWDERAASAAGGPGAATAMPPQRGASPPAAGVDPHRYVVTDPRRRRRARAPEPEPEFARWGLAIQTEGAIGASEDVFYNHFVGARLDFHITRDISLGAYFSYVNLQARGGRADNIFFLLQFENRIRLSPGLDLTIPLRAAIGYLPFNGPVLRFAAGLNYAFDSEWEIAFDIISPTFWFLPDRVAISLNLAAELQYRF